MKIIDGTKSEFNKNFQELLDIENKIKNIQTSEIEPLVAKYAANLWLSDKNSLKDNFISITNMFDENNSIYYFAYNDKDLLIFVAKNDNDLVSNFENFKEAMFKELGKSLIADGKFSFSAQNVLCIDCKLSPCRCNEKIWHCWSPGHGWDPSIKADGKTPAPSATGTFKEKKNFLKSSGASWSTYIVKMVPGV